MPPEAVGLALPRRLLRTRLESTGRTPTVYGMTPIVGTPMTASRPDSAGPRGLRPIARRLWTDTWYLLSGFPLAVASFVIVVSGVATGVAGMILVGPPVLAATLLAAGWFADRERRRIAPVLGMRLTAPAYRVAPPDSGVLRRMLNPITDPRRWQDALHAALVPVVSMTTLAFAVVWWFGAITLLSYPFYDWAVPPSEEHQQIYGMLGLPDIAPVRIVTHFALGLFFGLSLPFVLRGGAYFQASLGRALLTEVPGLRERITGLEADKAVAEARTTAAVSAEAIALRRLERDIHDGPQQRLVRLAMDLGRAQWQLDADPIAARQSVAEALAQTRETLDELRALSRGIAPPVLVDRGLAAAIAGLASRCTVPVDLAAPELGRLDPAVENTAYFVIAESLTNVAKHSGATECRVRLERLGDRLLVTVSDDGVGGAHLAKGHGLTGLADRAHAVGGTLAVHSLDGGPTTISAELPWR